MNSRFSVEGAIAIVTGGNRGIGETIAIELAKAGAAGIAVTSRSQEELNETVTQIEQIGAEGLAIEADIRDSEKMAHVVDCTIDEWGTLDVMVNNAAGSFGCPPEELSRNGFATIVDINLNSRFEGCTLAAERFMKSDGGIIINISSMAVKGYPLAVHYAASKAGVESLTQSLAMAWEEENIRVNCIRPGWVNTPGIRQQYGVDVVDIEDRSDTSRPVGLPEEIADIALFLSSEASSFINGEIITAQGTPQGSLRDLENV